MGKSNSKSAGTRNADPQIRIVDNQELHGEMLEHHESLIYIILAIVVVQLLITLYTILKRREQKRAFKHARSMNNIASFVV